MTIKIKDLLIILAVTFLILFALERISAYILEKKAKNASDQQFRRQFSGKDLKFMNDCCSYREVDPLLGWAMTGKQLRDKGWSVVNNCIRLEHILPGATDTLVIFITGGSTSDLGLNPQNWPIRLSERLKAKNMSFIIYIGAVGAYGTGQELLKLIRDGLPLQPAIHISYSGANEYQNPYFVSPYEQTFFNRSLFNGQTSRVLPNTIYLLKDLFHLNRQQLVLKDYPTSNGLENWKNNLAAMEALADGNGYTFLGILQPVVGFGKVKDTKKDPDVQPLLEEYRNFYPGAMEHVQNTPYIADFTSIFDDVGDQAFNDDCHIKDEYQDRVAELIQQLIDKRSANHKPTRSHIDIQ